MLDPILVPAGLDRFWSNKEETDKKEEGAADGEGAAPTGRKEELAAKCPERTEVNSSDALKGA